MKPGKISIFVLAVAVLAVRGATIINNVLVDPDGIPLKWRANGEHTTSWMEIVDHTGALIFQIPSTGIIPTNYLAGSGGGSSGGDTVFTNVAGIVQYSPGQAVTNELRVVSGSADAATNVAFTIDTANYWPAFGSLLLALKGSNTNQLLVTTTGGLAIGPATLPNWGAPSSGEALVSYRDIGTGDQNNNAVILGIATNGNQLAYGSLELTSLGSTLTLLAPSDGGQDSGTWRVRETTNYIQATIGGTQRLLINPTAVSTGSAVAYMFDTSNTLTNGDKLVSIRNAGTEVLSVTPHRLAIAGGFEARVVGTSSTPYTVVATDYTILVDTSGGAFTVNLPACSGQTRILNIKKISADANALTLDGDSSETIDGATTQSNTNQWFNFQIQSSGTNWFIL